MEPSPRGLQPINQYEYRDGALEQSQNEMSRPLCPYCYTIIECRALGLNTCQKCKKQCDVVNEDSLIRAKKVTNFTVVETPGFGKGLAIGFSILIIIWALEIIGDWSSIQNEKAIYYGTESDEDPVYQYDECNPTGGLTDAEKCSDLRFEDYIDSRNISMMLEIAKVAAWMMIWGSLGRVMLFNNLAFQELEGQNSKVSK